MPSARLLEDAFGWVRGPVPAPSLPEPETRLRRTTIRVIALAALLVSTVYLGWRLTSTLDLGVWWASIPLVVLEIHAALGLALFTFSLWDVDRLPAHRDVTQTPLHIAVLVPTLDEAIEILIPTIAAAASMHLPHETWILDDGNREDVEGLAQDLGVRYLGRPEPARGKAGTLNHALATIDADLVAILDADHVADPDFLVRTVGYFDDVGVGLVQTPHEFYNHDSFEHEAVAGDGERLHEQTLFFRMLQPGKNRWGGAVWCGSGAVARVAALQDVNGVATATIAPDIQTTIRLHRHGWRTVYHNEVLARGLAAPDADTYQRRRLRRGIGAMQVLRRENPLWVSGLTIPQRLSYAATLLGWFGAWRTLGVAILPMVVVVTGVVPIRADAVTFAAGVTLTVLLQQLALRALSRGSHRSVLSTVFGFVRMTPDLRATLGLVTGRSPAVATLPKGHTAEGRHRVHVPLLLRALLVASALSAAWYALSMMGRTPVTYAEPGAILAAFWWLLLVTALVILAMSRIRSLDYAPERRASVRFEVTVPGVMADLAAEARDISTTGVRVIIGTEVPVGDEVAVTLSFDDAPIELAGIVRSVRRDPGGGVAHGIEFLPGQHAERARLALTLFRRWERPRVDRSPVPAAGSGPTPAAARRPARVRGTASKVAAEPATAGRASRSPRKARQEGTQPVERATRRTGGRVKR